MKILFLGDFFYDYDYITEDIKKISQYIKKNNYKTILNLEGSIKTNKPIKKGINLAFSDNFIEILKMLNVVAVNLANNHVMDFGEEGLKLVIEKLDNANIKHFGAGINLNKAFEICNITIDNKLISLGGYGWNMEESINAKKNMPGTAPINFKIINDIARKTNNLFIPIFHYGYEYEKLPQPYHLIETRKLLYNNDNIKFIIGHHPHVVQAFEKNIYYSLGNFYFGKRREYYYNMQKYSNETSFGIGVIFDLDTFEEKVIGFRYNGKETIIEDKVKNLIDITSINNENYLKYFYTNNNILNKKYIYKTGFFNEKILNKFKYYRRTSKKYYLRNVKWPIIKKIKKIIKKGR